MRCCMFRAEEALLTVPPKRMKSGTGFQPVRHRLEACATPLEWGRIMRLSHAYSPQPA